MPVGEALKRQLPKSNTEGKWRMTQFGLGLVCNASQRAQR